MAKVPAQHSRIYFDEFELTGFLNATELQIKQETIPVTTFADAGPRRLVGNYDDESVHNGFFDGADNAFDERAFVDLSTDEEHYLGQGFGAVTVEGGIIYETIKRLREKPVSAQIGGAVLLHLTADGAGGAARSTVLSYVSATGTGNRTGRNQGATVAGQTYQAVFRVVSVAGTGSITLKIQESQNDGGADAYADIAGLTETFTAVGVSRKTTIAATEAWKRLSISAFSGFTSAFVLVTGGVVQQGS